MMSILHKCTPIFQDKNNSYPRQQPESRMDGGHKNKKKKEQDNKREGRDKIAFQWRLSAFKKQGNFLLYFGQNGRKLRLWQLVFTGRTGDGNGKIGRGDSSLKSFEQKSSKSQDDEQKVSNKKTKTWSREWKCRTSLSICLGFQTRKEKGHKRREKNKNKWKEDDDQNLKTRQTERQVFSIIVSGIPLRWQRERERERESQVTWTHSMDGRQLKAISAPPHYQSMRTWNDQEKSSPLLLRIVFWEGSEKGDEVQVWSVWLDLTEKRIDQNNKRWSKTREPVSPSSA